MSIIINIRYHGKDGSALKFAKEMVASGIAAEIRREPGNLRYDYYVPLEDPETVLLIDQWEDQDALDLHHGSLMMEKITKLRAKYDLHMEVERYTSEEEIPEADRAFIVK